MMLVHANSSLMINYCNATRGQLYLKAQVVGVWEGLGVADRDKRGLAFYEGGGSLGKIPSVNEQ